MWNSCLALERYIVNSSVVKMVVLRKIEFLCWPVWKVKTLKRLPLCQIKLLMGFVQLKLVCVDQRSFLIAGPAQWSGTRFSLWSVMSSPCALSTKP